MRIHNHSGVTKRHLIKQQHKDKKTQTAHNHELNVSERKRFWQGEKPVIKEIVRKTEDMLSHSKLVKAKEEMFSPVVKEDDNDYVMMPIDDDGYINVDLRHVKQNGLRVMFERIEGRTRKSVALQIDNWH